jgi:hypothetical protein
VSNTPYFPKKLPIVLIATLATLFIAAGFITTGELARRQRLSRRARRSSRWPRRRGAAPCGAGANRVAKRRWLPGFSRKPQRGAAAGCGGRAAAVRGDAAMS